MADAPRSPQPTEHDQAQADLLKRLVGEVFPGMVTMTRQSRQMLVRMVEYLAGEAGIRQFLDIGTGLPEANNTHEVAQRAAPRSRIVYVDNDRCQPGRAHAC